jgi:hypothetical protein
MFDVLISRHDAHKLQLNNMDANGNLVDGNIRYWITPQLVDGAAYMAIVDGGKMLVSKFFSLLK